MLSTVPPFSVVWFLCKYAVRNDTQIYFQFQLQLIYFQLIDLIISMYLNNNLNICLIIFGIFIIDMDSSFFVLFVFVYLFI